MVTKPDVVELIGVLLVVAAVTVLASWPWAAGVLGLVLIAKAAEMERR